jgi:hypothetical protein
VTPAASEPESLSPGRIAQPVRGRPFHRFFWKRLHVPRRVVHSALSAAKYAGNPTQVRLRRALALDAEVTRRAAVVVPAEKGFAQFAAGQLDCIDEVTSRCRRVFEARRSELSEQAFVLNRNKLFLLSVLAGNDFCAHPELLRFMVSRPILDAATRYLGAVPLLAGANLWWSPVNDSAAASQLFHTDNEDWSQLKVFVNIFDTSDEHGPFTLLPADISESVCRRHRYSTGRLSDEQVFSSAPRDDTLRLVGPPGSGGFVDTSRCLHFGSRANSADRLVLAFQFLRFDSPTESSAPLRVPAGLAGLHADPIQRLALGLR